MKRGRCDSALCNARLSLTKYLNHRLDEAGLHSIDQERNTNRDILRLLRGNQVKLFLNGKDEKEWMKEGCLIDNHLYEVLYDLCE